MSTGATSSYGVSVEVRRLCKGFGGQPVLRDVSFSVERGEIFAIMGPSGSGKTVLLKHLIGLETPDKGEILIEGQPWADGKIMDRYRLAMVFQSGALLNSLTVEENVSLYLTEHRLKPLAEIEKIVAQALDLVGMGGSGHKLPGELSGGMRKRVSIARALTIQPQLMLYDEPTSELDPLMAVAIGEEILRLKQHSGLTTILVTHDRDLALGVADRIAILHEGLILTVGTPAEVRAFEHPLVRKFLTIDYRPNSSKP
jgi:phospholipid/cholesterol/gamma-HCH transport system ATP-binding protein